MFRAFLRGALFLGAVVCAAVICYLGKESLVWLGDLFPRTVAFGSGVAVFVLLSCAIGCAMGADW